MIMYTSNFIGDIFDGNFIATLLESKYAKSNCYFKTYMSNDLNLDRVAMVADSDNRRLYTLNKHKILINQN